MTIHAFQERGLGEAPYTYICEVDSGSVKAGHTCDFCGTAIRFLEIIQDAHGNRYTVGNECIRKHGDSGLIDTVKRAQRAARAKALADAQMAKAQIELNKQRERNGGLTDWELFERQSEVARKVRLDSARTANVWLLDALRDDRGDFERFMIATLQERPAIGLSERCRRILADIYASRHGRRGSQANYAAYRDAAERLQI